MRRSRVLLLWVRVDWQVKHRLLVSLNLTLVQVLPALVATRVKKRPRHTNPLESTAVANGRVASWADNALDDKAPDSQYAKEHKDAVRLIKDDGYNEELRNK